MNPSPDSPIWAGRQAAIATKHGKERAFGPPLFAATGVYLAVAPIDTDLLGTFTGDVPRPGSPLETARLKARMAIAHTGAPIGLGSEGSFGPDPYVPFIPVNHEIVVLLDREEDLEITVELVSTETNWARVDLPHHELPDGAFLDRVGFPHHALVVMATCGPPPLVSGITNAGQLHDAIKRLRADGHHTTVQTDMRAHHNPSRRRVLNQLGALLADRLHNRCSTCGAPGFGPVGTEAGLPCEWCGLPTDLAARDLLECARSSCDNRVVRDRPGPASAGSCARCNP